MEPSTWSRQVARVRVEVDHPGTVAGEVTEALLEGRVVTLVRRGEPLTDIGNL